MTKLGRFLPFYVKKKRFYYLTISTFNMKRYFFTFCAIYLLLFCQAQSNDIAIIPQPSAVKRLNGSFVLQKNSAVLITGKNNEVKKIAELLVLDIKRSTGFELKIGTVKDKQQIHLHLSESETSFGPEGYKLSVSPTEVIIQASKPAGLFYGTQTLLQLLPKEIASKTVVKGKKWNIPAVEITDEPRFGWRGLMLDVSRHFFTKAEVKTFIDEMAQYKYNLLHFHLTDDQGWRVEIKSYPKLTEVGAWNVKKTGTFGTFTAPAENEVRDHGGYYTQDDIRELIGYAKERYVNIMPEIDIPGHSLAAVASYPELSCTPGNYKVNSGEPFMNWHDDGTFSAMIDNTLCPANEKVYTFIDKVFTEVAQLFPFGYIHMGGDECAKNFWEKSNAVKELMEKEKLKDMHEVQSYFVGRVSKIVNAKGKKLIGWDEILEGGLVKDAAVMSWRGMKGGIEAAKMGHEVVMTPTTHVYLDYMQTDGAIEPPVYATLRLKKSYEFEPLPEGVDPKLIKGGQGNLWTEQMYNTRHLSYMTWPRAFAISEALWSPKTSRNWNDFVKRVEAHFARFDQADRRYAPSMYDPLINVSNTPESALLVDFDSELDALEIHYSFDNSFPDQHYPKYQGKSIIVPVDASTLKLISYRDNKPIGRLMVVTIDELKKRIKK